MSNDIRTALDIIQDETTIINAFIKLKEKQGRTISVQRCTDKQPCIKCRCQWCGYELFSFAKPLHIKLHNECYYKVIKEWVP